VAGQTANQVVVRVVAGLGGVVGGALAIAGLIGAGERILLPVGLAMAAVAYLLFRNAHRLAPAPPEEGRRD
jgi:hypothetical protein